MDAKLIEDGLYAANTSHLSKSNVVIFSRIECSTLAQAVYVLHCCLGHMPKSSLIYSSCVNDIYICTAEDDLPEIFHRI